MSDWNSPAISTIGTGHSKEQALMDARDIIQELGKQIIIKPFTESSVTRDKFNSIKKTNNSGITPFTLYAFPITFNPTEKELEEAGIREKTEVLIKTAMKDWTDQGYTMATLKSIDSIRLRVLISGATYEIVTKQLDSQYSDTYLYIHLGLNRV